MSDIKVSWSKPLRDIHHWSKHPILANHSMKVDLLSLLGYKACDLNLKHVSSFKLVCVSIEKRREQLKKRCQQTKDLSHKLPQMLNINNSINYLLKHKVQCLCFFFVVIYLQLSDIEINFELFT